MASTFTTNKNIEKPGYTDYASDPTGWTAPVNGDWDTIDKAFGGTHSVSLTSSNVTLTATQCQNARILLTGALSANITIFFPAGISGLFVVDNRTSSSFVVTLASAGGGPETRTAVRGANTLIWLDASTNGVYLADNSPIIGGIGLTVNEATVNLDVPVTVPNGGTGQTSYLPGQLLIGNNAGGLTPATLTSGSNINIVNGNGAITINAVGSAGGVTTFSGGTTGFTPNAPTAGAITLGGTLAVTNGGTGVTSSTGSGANVLSTSPTLVTPILGTPTSCVLTNATGLPLTTGVTGILGVANGGTGATTLTGYVKGSGTSALTAAATVPGSDLSGAYSAAALTVSSNRILGRYSGGSGSAEEIAIGSGLTLAGGTLSAASGGVDSISFGTTGFTPSTASTGAVVMTGTLAIASGGTGSTSESGARTALGLGTIATQSSSSVSITGGTINSVSVGGSASINTTGTITTTARGSFGTVRVGGSSFDMVSLSGGTGGFNFASDTSITGTSGVMNSFVGAVAGWNLSTTSFGLSSAMTSATCFFGTTWTNISDARTKTDVSTYSLGASALNTLRPITYVYNGEYGTPDNGIVQAGLIAQEVLETPFASMVGTREYTDPDTGEKTTLYDLNTNQLVFALINAVKELSARIDELEAR